MADDRHYVPGDWYMICERTGFKVRAAKMRQEWTGRMIRDQSWERRHPQDFVRGLADDQHVDIPRPRQTDQFQGPLQTAVLSAVAAGSQLVNVFSSTRMQIGDRINIMLDTGVNFSTFITNIISLTRIQISPVMPYSAAAGNLITDVTAESLPNIG